MVCNDFHCPPPQPARPCTVLLGAGQSLQQRWPAGTHVQLHSGQLSLQEPPLWLGERVWQASHQLASGQGLVLHQGGWVTLWAQQDARLQVCMPRRSGGLWAGWRRLLGLAQRRGRSAA